MVILSVSIATIPGEWIEEKVGLQDLTRILFDERNAPFHRNLILRELTLVRQAPPPELLAAYDRMEKETDLAWRKYAKGLNLKGRDLRFADLSKANLTKIDLREAKLQHANLGYVQLQGANLMNAQLQGADLGYAKLQGANLGYVQFKDDAYLGYVQLQGADLEYAQLQSGNLMSAQLQYANLSKSKIGGTDFAHASLCLSDLREVNCTPMTPGDWQKLEEKLKKTIPEGKRLNELLKRLKKASQRNKTKFKDVVDAKNVLSHHPLICGEFHVQNINEPDYYCKLTQFLFSPYCNNKYIAQSIARRVISHKAELPQDVLDKFKKITEKAQEEKNQ